MLLFEFNGVLEFGELVADAIGVLEFFSFDKTYEGEFTTNLLADVAKFEFALGELEKGLIVAFGVPTIILLVFLDGDIIEVGDIIIAAAGFPPDRFYNT